jgi:hypothetical protein
MFGIKTRVCSIAGRGISLEKPAGVGRNLRIMLIDQANQSGLPTSASERAIWGRGNCPDGLLRMDFCGFTQSFDKGL